MTQPMTAAEVISQKQVLTWLEAAKEYHPTIEDELRYLLILHFSRSDRRREATAKILVSSRI
jgi:hypothetical protein